MAQRIIRLGELVTAAATADEFIINDATATLQQPSQTLTLVTPSGNAGTIKIAIGIAPPAGHEAIGPGRSISIHGVQPGYRNLWVVGSDAAQNFIVY